MINQYSFGYLSPFVGRTQELEEIAVRLADPHCRLLTLTGLGGSGKTRLAIEASRVVAAHFPHGTVFVGLQPLPRSDLLVPTIAQALGLTFYGQSEPQQQLLDHLREKTLLLLLDNFEHLLDGSALITALLAYAPGVKIVVTSREVLNVREEWLYPLKGMATPPSIYATALEDYDAVQLFLSHVRRVQPHFELASDPEAVIRICQMTAGLPLALELAASWFKGSSAAHVAQAMQHSLDVLSTSMRNVEERHRSMRAVFDQAWILLSESERLIFARLSVFPGSFDSAAADAVAAASFASLAALVEKSLVQMDVSDRFGIHEILRQYSKEHLEAYGETATTYARHSQHFARLMLQHEAALQQPQQVATIQAIERDFDNIRLAWEWAARNGHLDHLHTMLNGLYLFGFLGSRYRETITLFQDTLDLPIDDVPLRGRLLARRWGYLHWWYYADYGEALTCIEQALTIARAENNRFEIAFSQFMVAYAMISMQRYAEALTHLEASRVLFEAINEPYYVCWVLHRLGFTYYNLNDGTRGIAYTEQSLALARVAYNRAALVSCLYSLGALYVFTSDYVTGRNYTEEALQFATETGHQDQISYALSLLALCAFFQGDYAACQSYAERSRAINETTNSFVFEPYSLASLILLACLREDYTEGVRLNVLGKHHSTNRLGLQFLYWALAALACGVEHPDDVRLYIQNVLELAVPDIRPGPVIWIVPCVAYLLAATDPEKAVELLAWSFSHPDPALQWVRHWPLFTRLQAQLHAVMEPDAYQRYWETGAALTFDAIATYLHHTFGATATTNAPGEQHLLTTREQEILHLLAAGLTNPQIAAQLVIGAGTVKTHTLNIYRKLEVANRTQAIVRAQGLGLLHS